MATISDIISGSFRQGQNTFVQLQQLKQEEARRTQAIKTAQVKGLKDAFRIGKDDPEAGNIFLGELGVLSGVDPKSEGFKRAKKLFTSRSEVIRDTVEEILRSMPNATIGQISKILEKKPEFFIEFFQKRADRRRLQELGGIGEPSPTQAPPPLLARPGGPTPLSPQQQVGVFEKRGAEAATIPGGATVAANLRAQAQAARQKGPVLGDDFVRQALQDFPARDPSTLSGNEIGQINDKIDTREIRKTTAQANARQKAKLLADLDKRKIFLRQMSVGIMDMGRLIKGSPDILSVSGGLARATNSLVEQARGLLKLTGFDLDDSLLDPNRYSGIFQEQAIKSAELQAAIVNVSTAAAAAAEPGRLTEQDIERRVRELAASTGSVPVFTATLFKFGRRAERGFRIHTSVLTGKDPGSGVRFIRPISKMGFDDISELAPDLLTNRERAEVRRRLTILENQEIIRGKRRRNP